MGVSAEDQLKELKRGCEEILLEEELLKSFVALLRTTNL